MPLKDYFRHITPASGKFRRAISLPVMAACIALCGCHPSPAAPPTVEVERVSPENVSVYGEYPGRIRAVQTFEIHARVDGYLDNMFVHNGSPVRRGQTLFVIDSRLYKANADKARAQLSSARAQELKTRRDLERIRPLFEKNAASQLDLDNAEAAYESAKADVAICEADLITAETSLDNTKVTAPVTGEIYCNVADIGSMVGPSGKSLLATIIRNDTVSIDFTMSARDYFNAKSQIICAATPDSVRCLDTYVTITLSDGSEYPHKAKVNFGAPTINPETGEFTLSAEMPNPQRMLMPGEVTRVNVLVTARNEASLIPLTAVKTENDSTFAYVLGEDNVITRRHIITGPVSGSRIIIENGLTDGELIVVKPTPRIADGMSATGCLKPSSKK